MGDAITRRTFGRIVAGSTVASGLLAREMFWSSGLMAADDDGKVIFPYGTHVYREPHLPMEQFRHDFPILKRLGFNMIKIQEVWAYDEPEEGKIDLSSVSQVVSDARQNGLRVYFGVTMENPPAWFWTKYPDAYMVYEDGQPNLDPTLYVLPNDGKPGPCWHHPKALELGTRFVEAVGKEIGKYDNIEVWNVFQEIGFALLKPGHLGVCFCPNTLTAFRKWLRSRYSSLKDLNATWLTAYGDWDEVQPPRISPKVPPTIDWRYFMDDEYLAGSLKWKGDALRRTDPLHRRILAHVGGVTIGGTSEWRFARELDILGSSCYPAWAHIDPWDSSHPTAESPMTEAAQDNHEVSDVVMHFDYLRSSKPDGHIWTAELQGGPINEGLDRRGVPSPSDIRRWVFSCLAAGTRGICYWNHRPEIFWEEGYGFSLLDWGSDSSERASEAGRIARALNENAELFVNGEHARSQIGIVVNEDTFHFAQGSLRNTSAHLEYTVAGNWKSFWRQGYPVDFVDLATFPSPSTRYKILVLPFPMPLSQSLIAKMTEYVSDGGTLVVEACPGRFSSYGIAFDGGMAPGISELFGASHQGVSLIREPNHGAKWTNTELGPRDFRDFKVLQGKGSLASQSVFPAFYLQTLTPTKATPVLLYDEEIVGCVNDYGRGKAYLFGTLLGHAGPAYDDWRNAALLSSIAAQAGVMPDSVGRLRRRRRVLGDRAAWFFFNSSDSRVEETVPLEGYKGAQDLLGGALPEQSGSFRLALNPFEVSCVLLRK
jgi:beta-galactosidase